MIVFELSKQDRLKFRQLQVAICNWAHDNDESIGSNASMDRIDARARMKAKNGKRFELDCGIATRAHCSSNINHRQSIHVFIL